MREAADKPSVVEPMTCNRCGYVLEHLSVPRCPECGERFDLNDLRTYAGGPLRRETRFPRSTWSAVLALLAWVGALVGLCWLMFALMRQVVWGQV
jgi:hypothetical protein